MIAELAPEEIDAFLRGQLVGRIGCHAWGETYVVPVIYAWDGDALYVQSIDGRKIRMMRENPRVCFEVDEYLPDGSWRSVIVDGEYEELAGDGARHALDLLVERMRLRGGPARERPRAEGRTPVAFRIRSIAATGRAVRR